MTAIVKYNAGNTQSVENAVKRLGYECIVTADTDLLLNADNVIFPGVGHAATAMAHLNGTELDTLLPQLTQPVLGVCLGLQLMCRFTEEGNTLGLGIFDVDVKRFPPTDIVPHMGWNNVNHNGIGLFKGIAQEEHFYFVHSYYAGICADTSAQCNYILPYSAALQKDNFYAVQFHPEKSGIAGAQLLKNFLSL